MHTLKGQDLRGLYLKRLADFPERFNSRLSVAAFYLGINSHVDTGFLGHLVLGQATLQPGRSDSACNLLPCLIRAHKVYSTTPYIKERLLYPRKETQASQKPVYSGAIYRQDGVQDFITPA